MPPKKLESARKAEFERIIDLISTHEVATIFEGLNLNKIDCIISVTIKKLEDLSFILPGESKPLALEENKIYQIKALEEYISSIKNLVVFLQLTIQILAFHILDYLSTALSREESRICSSYYLLV